MACTVVSDAEKNQDVDFEFTVNNQTIVSGEPKNRRILEIRAFTHPLIELGKWLLQKFRGEKNQSSQKVNFCISILEIKKAKKGKLKSLPLIGVS